MSQLSDIKATATRSQTKRSLPYIAAAVLGLVTIFMVYAAFVSPSKQPYRDAAAKYQAVYNANVAFTEAGTALGTSTATDQQFKQNIEATKTKLEALEAAATALGKQAVVQEGEGKVLYQAFMTQLERYTKYNTDILASISKLRPVLYECNNKSARLSEDKASAIALRACVKGLKAVGSVPDADYQAMLDSFITHYTDLATNIAIAAALKHPEGADAQRQATLEDERGSSINSLNTASRTLSQDLQTHRAEVDITETAKALDEYLSKKASVFSL